MSVVAAAAVIRSLFMRLLLSVVAPYGGNAWAAPELPDYKLFKSL
jgi:hypothetical protein